MAIAALAKIGSVVANMAPKVAGFVQKIKTAAPKIGDIVSNMSQGGMNAGNKLFQTSSTLNDALGSRPTTQNTNSYSQPMQISPLVLVAAAVGLFLIIKK